MSIKVIKDFSEKAKAEPELKEKLKACLKIKELLALAKEFGFEIDEVSLYPPNEPQFTEDQLSEKLVKALLRA
jgi:predicted ribosomally synthesized peptide with nif11-like leader